MIEALQRAIEPVRDVRLAVLFGSAAQGTARPGSDLDVGVLLERDGDPDLLPTLQVAIERATARRVDLVPLETAAPLLRFEIARRGVVLVERVPRAWADFRARALIDWWDWAPTARMMHETLSKRLAEEARRGQS